MTSGKVGPRRLTSAESCLLVRGTAAVMTLAVVACGSRDATAPPLTPSCAAISWVFPSPKNDTVAVGDTIHLTAETYPLVYSPQYRWTSLFPTVASIDQGGLLTAHFPGEVAVYASAGECSVPDLAYIRVHKGQASLPLTEGPFVSIAAGGRHTCALTASGAAWCWGANPDGELGFEPTGCCTGFPAQVNTAVSFATISTGSYHTCGLTSAGKLHCWGGNQFNQIGDGTTIDRTRPVAILPEKKFTLVVTGNVHTCALEEGGQAYCWGKLELLPGQPIPAPTAVAGGHSFREISASGGDHTCGITTAGILMCWGQYPYRTTPVSAEVGSSTFVKVFAGNQLTCALTSSGSPWCWGMALGNGSMNSTTVPAPITTSLTFRTLVVASKTACGLTSDDRAFCWGWGEFGNGQPMITSLVPVEAGNGLRFSSLAMGAVTCGIVTNDGAYCWGSSGYQDWRLGTGTIVSAAQGRVPHRVGRQP